MTEDFEQKYNDTIKYIGYRDAVIKEAIKETLQHIHPEITQHRRYQSGQLNEIVSLLLDALMDQHSLNIELNKSLTFEQGACKLWREACEELTKENEEWKVFG